MQQLTDAKVGSKDSHLTSNQPHLPDMFELIDREAPPTTGPYLDNNWSLVQSGKNQMASYYFILLLLFFLGGTFV